MVALIAFRASPDDKDSVLIRAKFQQTDKWKRDTDQVNAISKRVLDELAGDLLYCMRPHT